ncbi:hypothetical protein Ct61P_00027 [Colletotrichum tofieldiae]|nr:hypothetical protein Ct61P_00027 [Colletotrichum tofieldiae]
MARTTSALPHRPCPVAQGQPPPETQFNEIIQRGIERRYTTPNVVDEAKELKQVNALYALADDRFKKRPTYFQDLLRELEEAPTRGWLQNVSKKLSGMFRFQ